MLCRDFLLSCGSYCAVVLRRERERERERERGSRAEQIDLRHCDHVVLWLSAFCVSSLRYFVTCDFGISWS